MLKTLKKWYQSLGLARGLIFIFCLALFLVAYLQNMQMKQLISDSLLRVARNGVLVLALLPGIRGGIGLNFGLPLGILCGLVGMILTLNQKQNGFLSLTMALFYASVLAVIVGYAYGILLNRVKGNEMMVGTYLGFASVSLMSIFWLLFTIKNQALVWAIGGKGLRTTLSLADSFGAILDNFLTFNFYGVMVPTGTGLFFLLMCLLMSLFFKTKTGLFMSVCGSNPVFAKANGLNYNEYRVLATIFSTVLGAVGIVIYAQSYGYVQLYTAPLLMAFPLMACILIGGANLKTATVFHVLFGTAVFQSLLTIALPISSATIGGDISETARIIILNGIILYALVAVAQDEA